VLHPAGEKMNKPVKIKETRDRIITPGGLALVGSLLAKTSLARMINRLGKPTEVKHQNANCVIPYIALLCQGKTAYDDMRELQEDIGFSCRALRINTLPSAETVRQRLDYLGKDIAESDTIMDASVEMLKSTDIKPTAAFTGQVPIDVDVSVHDNSNTKKEGVQWTYKGVDGYAPIYAYIGEEGYVCNAKLREGSCHSNCAGTLDFLAKTIGLAKRITSEKLLVRLDSGNDSIDNIKLFVKEGTDYIIKRNFRKESLDRWLAIAEKHGKSYRPRAGKVTYIGSVYRKKKGLETPLRIVFKVSEITSRPNGQMLVIPEIDVDTWWTSLPNPEQEIIRSYSDHAICEQFHSEIKSDMGLERFPSGKFNTNAAILKLAGLAFNILRVIGQSALRTEAKLTRHEVKRLRAKTVINRFMLIACRIIAHAREVFLTLGQSNIWRHTFVKLYEAFG
jgi:hypothetical protein